MIKIPIASIESKLPYIIKTNYCSVGVDTASRTGLCVAKTTDTEIVLEYSFLDMKSTNKYHKYNTLIAHMDTYLKGKKADILVVEETFFGTNAKVFQFLSRIGGMVYTVGHLLDIKEKMFITAVQSRKALELPCNKKKEVVHEAFHILFPEVKITDIDIIDAVILAINGLLLPKGLVNG
jgi:Holliday junction resolvasome RuvABC endonuclease subunit